MEPTSPLVANGLVYIGDGEGYLNAVDAVTGQLSWRSRAGPWSVFAQLVGNELFYATTGGTLQLVDAMAGNLNWSVVLALNPFDQAGAVIANGAIYVGDNNGTLHAINASSGATIWTLPLTGADFVQSLYSRFQR